MAASSLPFDSVTLKVLPALYSRDSMCSFASRAPFAVSNTTVATQRDLPVWRFSLNWTTLIVP